MTERAGTRLDPKRRRGYIARPSDIERLDEKVDAIEDVAPELFAREPRAVRQAAKKFGTNLAMGGPGKGIHGCQGYIRASSPGCDPRTPTRVVSPPSRLPAAIKTKIVSFGEQSYGAYKVALVLTDGEIIEDVIVAWGDEVVRVAGVDVAAFDTSTGGRRHRP